MRHCGRSVLATAVRRWSTRILRVIAKTAANGKLSSTFLSRLHEHCPVHRQKVHTLPKTIPDLNPIVPICVTACVSHFTGFLGAIRVNGSSAAHQPLLASAKSVLTGNSSVNMDTTTRSVPFGRRAGDSPLKRSTRSANRPPHLTDCARPPARATSRRSGWLAMFRTHSPGSARTSRSVSEGNSSWCRKKRRPTVCVSRATGSTGGKTSATNPAVSR